MLSWIKLKRSDHPLDDALEAKRAAETLANAEPFHALGQISAYLDAIKTADKLRPLRGVEIVDLLDRAARVPQRRLNYDYVMLGRRLTRFQDNRIWSTAYDYWTQLAEAYRFCLSAYEVGAFGSQALKPHLPKIIARTTRARGQQLKWALMRYDAVDLKIWEDLRKLYAMAEACGVHQSQIQLYRAGQQDSTVEREFLRVLMLAVSAPDALLPIQIEVADRLVAHCAQGFQVQARLNKELLFAFDLATPQAPSRISSRTKTSPSLRYFGATQAGKNILTPLITSIAHYKQVPREINLGIHPSVEAVLDTVQHLSKHWSIEPPRRSAIRKRRLEKVSVVHDYEEVVANAGGLFLEYPFVSNDEPWILENEGGDGVGALVAKPHGTWMRAGSLIAIRREECVSWSVGVLRRISADRDGNRQVGIQTICEGGTAVTLFPVSSAKDKPKKRHEVRDNALSEEGEICVLVPSPEQTNSGQATLLIRQGLYVPATEVEMRAYEQRYLLMPLKILMRGEDFELAQFRIKALS